MSQSVQEHACSKGPSGQHLALADRGVFYGAAPNMFGNVHGIVHISASLSRGGGCQGMSPDLQTDLCRGKFARRRGAYKLQVFGLYESKPLWSKPQDAAVPPQSNPRHLLSPRGHVSKLHLNLKHDSSHYTLHAKPPSQKPRTRPSSPRCLKNCPSRKTETHSSASTVTVCVTRHLQSGVSLSAVPYYGCSP